MPCLYNSERSSCAHRCCKRIATCVYAPVCLEPAAIARRHDRLEEHRIYHEEEEEEEEEKRSVGIRKNNTVNAREHEQTRRIIRYARKSIKICGAATGPRSSGATPRR